MIRITNTNDFIKSWMENTNNAPYGLQNLTFNGATKGKTAKIEAYIECINKFGPNLEGGEFNIWNFEIDGSEFSKIMMWCKNCRILGFISCKFADNFPSEIFIDYKTEFNIVHLIFKDSKLPSFAGLIDKLSKNKYLKSKLRSLDFFGTGAHEIENTKEIYEAVKKGNFHIELDVSTGQGIPGCQTF